MCDLGIIDVYGKLETTTGRPPAIYGLNPNSGYFVGVDFNKFNVSIGIINFKGDLVEGKLDIPYQYENTQASLDALCDIVKNFIANSKVPNDKILNVAFAVSGRVNPKTGQSFTVFNFTEQPLAEVLSEKIGRPVCIDNDTRVMAYGELIKGALAGCKDAVFVNLSWGLGMAILIDGSVYRGKSGFAGEIGHIKTYDNEVFCHCGKKGCLETEVSGSAFMRRLIERIKAGEASILSQRVLNNEKIVLNDLMDALRKEDPLCIDIVQRIAFELGQHMAGVVNIFNPETIVIGGDLVSVSNYLTEPIQASLKRFSLNLVSKDSTIEISKLGKKGTVMGACLFARSQMFEV